MSGRSLARRIGRGAIWAVVALLLLRGLGSTLSTSKAEPSPAPRSGSTSDLGADTLAVRFARTYLTDPSAESLAPFLAEGSSIGTGLPPDGGTGTVAQAEASATEQLGHGESVVTVACELRDARTLYLAVPIVRSEAGEVAVLGAPSIVAGPGTATGVEGDRPRSLVGAEGPAIESLTSKFLPAYIASEDESELAYLVVPGGVVQPIGGEVELQSIAAVAQLGDGEGPHRTVLVSVRVSDPASGATYPLAYRLEVERSGKGGRWYVAAVEGVSA